MIAAFQKDKPLLADISSHLSAPGLHIWWLGQSGFLLAWQGKTLLFDPYLSDSLTKKYASTAKPHVRMSERAIDPALLPPLDVVTSSHNHTDHLDAETLLPIFEKNPSVKFVIPEANRDFVANRTSCPRDFPIGMTDGQTIEIQGFKLTCVPAAHNEIERDELGRCRFVGFVAEFGGYSVYHSGDTLWYDGMVEILKKFNLDVAFLPINGNRPERGVAGNLDCREAAELGKQIGARLVIPHHFHMFEFNTADPEDFEKEAKKIAQPYRILRIGERYSLH